MALANSSMIRTGGIISRVAAGAGLAVAGMGILSLRAAGNFQQSMNILQAVSGATTEQFKGLHDEAIALGRDMKLPNVSAQDAADAMTELSKAGLSVKDVMAATRGTLQFGIAANIGFADSANIVARSLTAFGLSGGHATEVADLFTAAANKSTASATDIALGFQMASAQFKAGDQTIQGLTTSLTLMANAGIVGSDAGTSLKTMMNRLMAPTNKAKKLMADLGFSVYDSSGNMKSMPNIIQNLGNSLKGMSKEQRNAALYTIFGSDAIRAARVQLAAGADGWRKMEDRITKGGEAQKFAEARTKGFNGAVQALFSAVETLAIELGEHMLPAAEKITRAMANFVNSLSADQIAAFFAPLAKGVEIIYNFISGSEIAQGVILAFVGALAGFMIINAIVGMVTALTTAITAMGAAMLANPIVLIAAAIIGLGVAAVYAYKHWEAFRNVADSVMQWLQANVLPIFGQIVDGVKRHMDDIKAVVNLALQAVLLYWNQYVMRIVNFVRANWDAIYTVIKAVLSNIMIEVRGVLKTIEGIFNLVMGIIRGDWGRAWQGIKQILDGTLGTIAALIKNTLTRLVPAVLGLALSVGKAIVKGILDALADLAGFLLGKLKSGVSSAISATAAAVPALAAAIGREIMNGIISGIGSLAGALVSKLKSTVTGAVSGLAGHLGIHSPSTLTRDEIGKPMGEGIIVGFLLGTNDLPDKISKKLKESLEAGKKVVEEYQSKFKTAFEGMANDALTAFDRMTEHFKTIHEKALAAFDLKQARIEAKKEMDKLVQDVQNAQAALLAQAAKGVEMPVRNEGESDADYQARVLEAQQKFNDEQANLVKQYNDAQTALEDERQARAVEKKRAHLQALADKERQNYEDRRAIQRRALEADLNQLEEFLLKHPQKWDQTQKKIIKLLADYGIKYHESGFAVGMAFAHGLEDSYGEIMQRAHDIAAAVAAVLKTGSPTKEGPMSDLDHWWDSFAPTLLQGLKSVPIERAALGIAGGVQSAAGTGPVLAQSASSATGNPTYVTYNVQGSLIREQELNDRIREAVNTEYRRGRTVNT